MHRMAVLALCTTDASLNIAKCVMLAVVHDIAEAQGTFTHDSSPCETTDLSIPVGDITPHEGFSKAEKHQLEKVCPTTPCASSTLDSQCRKR
jgi:putative hydrolase of HD superfamily